MDLFSFFLTKIDKVQVKTEFHRIGAAHGKTWVRAIDLEGPG